MKLTIETDNGEGLPPEIVKMIREEMRGLVKEELAQMISGWMSESEQKVGEVVSKVKDEMKKQIDLTLQAKNLILDLIKRKG